ncbi:DUF1707 domain-containing protein [Kitasatospora sp. NPDC057904]|uniref:DUF1707 SHOCT-like domain-containing protein n=1 Tax=Kitasatospora sp. NPDC057904 TaxID=3346275 RepID=UPI0036D78BAB
MTTGSRRDWISEAEREAVAAQLCEQFSRSLLTKAELETRLDDTFAAETHEALRHVTADLPAVRRSAPAGAAPPARMRAARGTRRPLRLRERHGTRALVYSIGLWAAGGLLFGAGWLGSGPARLLILLGLAAILVGGRPRRSRRWRLADDPGRRLGAFGPREWRTRW